VAPDALPGDGRDRPRAGRGGGPARGPGVIYDLVVTARAPKAPLESLVAALVPIYFGRVGSFVIENRHQTTDQAEERVERQAREFELLKPYVVDRWTALERAG
jgi:glucosylglycerate synthase